MVFKFNDILCHTKTLGSQHVTQVSPQIVTDLKQITSSHSLYHHTKTHGPKTFCISN